MKNKYQLAQDYISQGGEKAQQGIEILESLSNQNFQPAQLTLALQKMKSSPPTFDFAGAKKLLDSIENDLSGTKNYLLGEWYGAELLRSEDDVLIINAQENFLKAAKLGHVEAMLQLAYGYRQGVFINYADDFGCAWLEKAAEMNHPRALFELAIYKTHGIGCKKDLVAAKRLLNRSKDFNYPNAVALANNFEAFSKDKYGNPQSSTELHQNPKVCSLKHVLDVMECSHLAVLSMPFLEPSKVISTFGEAELVSGRRSMGTNFPPFRSDFVVNCIVLRLSEIAGQKPETAESMALLKYGEGEEYRVHPDYFEESNPNLRGLLEQGGQRVKTIVCYLNSVPAGGDTAFPDLGVIVSATAGDGVYFENTDERANVYPQSRHAGLPINQGSKWIVTLWFRETKHRD